MTMVTALVPDNMSNFFSVLAYVVTFPYQHRYTAENRRLFHMNSSNRNPLSALASYPLTSSERGMYLEQQLNPDFVLYN